MKSMETEAAIELISQELGGNAPSIQEEDTDIHYIWSVSDAWVCSSCSGCSVTASFLFAMIKTP